MFRRRGGIMNALMGLALLANQAMGQRVCAQTSALIGVPMPFVEIASDLTGVMTVIDDCHFQVHGFGMLGGPAVYFHALDLGERMADVRLDGGEDLNYTIELKPGLTFGQFQHVGVFCEEFQKVFGHVDLAYAYADPVGPPYGEYGETYDDVPYHY
eukprot:Selendium_serpulae@DN3496_c0_g1_i1.p1